MPRNATRKKASKPRLSAAEMTAIQHLMSGSSMTAAAEAAGVNRTTLHRWMRSKAHFREALDQHREDLQATFDARITVLVDVAIDRVKDGIWAEDSKTALAVLEKLGLLRAGRLEVSEVSETDTNAD